VVLAGFAMLIAEEAPDVLPMVWADTCVVIDNTAAAIHIRMTPYSGTRCYKAKSLKLLT
jgi:hypothetical protein